MPSLNGLSMSKSSPSSDREFEQARIFAEGRAQAERERAERRRDALVARGEARAVRGRLYDMIQTGRVA